MKKKLPPNFSSSVPYFVTIHSEKSVLDQSGVIRLWAFCNYKVIKIQIVPDRVKANKIAKILQTSSKYGKSQIFFSLYLTELLPFFLSRWTSTLAELSFFSSFFEPIVSKQSLHLTERTEFLILQSCLKHGDFALVQKLLLSNCLFLAGKTILKFKIQATTELYIGMRWDISNFVAKNDKILNLADFFTTFWYIIALIINLIWKSRTHTGCGDFFLNEFLWSFNKVCSSPIDKILKCGQEGM